MDLNKDYLQDLFIDEVKGCLGSDGGGGGTLPPQYDSDGDGVIDNAASLGGISAEQYALKMDIESSKATDEDANEVIDQVFGSDSVATEEEVSDVINSVFN